MSSAPHEVNRVARQVGFGSPYDVVELERHQVPVPGAGEVLVELVAAPVNPAETLMLSGEYGWRGTRPQLPRPMGIEGVGRVVGGAVDTVPQGSLVSLAGTAGVFGDFRVVPVDRVVVIPDGVDPAAASLLLVNLQSVLLMLHEWPEVTPGSWIVQNAGNSGYGRTLAAVAARRGVQVVNVVRSPAAAAALDGATGPVLVDDGSGDVEADVFAATGGAHPLVAVDAIGGAATGRLARLLAPGGRVVTYGLMAGEPCHVDPCLVVFAGVRLEGFWMPRSLMSAGTDVVSAVAREALGLLADRVVDVPVERRYGLDDLADALSHAERGGRAGKILVTR